jgi:hypothetical protein
MSGRQPLLSDPPESNSPIARAGRFDGCVRRGIVASRDASRNAVPHNAVPHLTSSSERAEIGTKV